VTEDERLSPWLSERQRQMLARRRTRPPQVALIDNARENLRRLHVAGVPVLAGTDAQFRHDAWRLAARRDPPARGRGPRSGGRACRRHVCAAAAFGLDDRGRIEAGKRADLLLVEGDPTRAVGATRAIVGIWKNGHEIARAPPEAVRAEPSVGAA
jgi:cytosine/adenosine deaminase-related metal-dependent hydrolase